MRKDLNIALYHPETKELMYRTSALNLPQDGDRFYNALWNKFKNSIGWRLYWQFKFPGPWNLNDNIWHSINTIVPGCSYQISFSVRGTGRIGIQANNQKIGLIGGSAVDMYVDNFVLREVF